MASLVLKQQRSKSAPVLEEIIRTIERIQGRREKATFNLILHELSSKHVLVFHRSLRSYLDLLLSSKALVVSYHKTRQPNIRPMQVYHVPLGSKYPIVEAGEKSLLFHGLNWDIPSPTSIPTKTDLLGLARARLHEGVVYASLEDSLVEVLARLKRPRGDEPAELAFLLALLATEKIDIEFLLLRAKKRGVADLIIAILSRVEEALTNPRPGVEDIRTLFELRAHYENLHRPKIRNIAKINTRVDNISKTIIPSNSLIVQYAGKQLGISG